ncbi:polysaccharide pyruvyl transferase family protein [Streptomyces sp. NPDC003456]|uniref:polysaccharide pyruvyl transferase family protein n=1 Tax=Streptomyces sp. NPDC003456 TaxID=3364683 RepID=UPI0036C6A9C3
MMRPVDGVRDRPPRILLVSSWQTINIGDVAHSPGALRAFQRFCEGAQVTLWAWSSGERERKMFAEHFPDVTIVEERLVEGEAPSRRILRLFEESDVLVHGSGPSILARAELEAWRAHTDKPYGFFGVTFDPLAQVAGPGFFGTLDEVTAMVEAISQPILSAADRGLLEGAAFLYCRDSLSVKYLWSQGLVSASFMPDAVVCCDLQDAEAGSALLTRLGCGEDFICVIPRLRFTPYHQIFDLEPERRHVLQDAVNATFEQSDMDALREIVERHVRRTGQHVLVCPEMEYEVPLAQAHFGPGDLAADVAPRVHVVPHFWSLTEAAAVYRRAAAVISMECHSPLIALAAGVPAIYLRQPTDTIKGHMYRDLGIGGRLVEAGPTAGRDAGRVLGEILSDREEAGRATLDVRAAAESLISDAVETIRVTVSRAVARSR